MPQAIQSAPDHRICGTAELTKVRRSTLLHARSFPPGPERNYHRQIASSLRSLFSNEAWRIPIAVKRLHDLDITGWWVAVFVTVYAFAMAPAILR